MTAVECAVVLTAGYGSRLFPVTAVVPKSLMPIGRYPVIHYVLADLVAAGVRDIAVVVGVGDSAVERYVRGDPQVAADFQHRGWSAKYDAVQEVHEELGVAEFTFIEQNTRSGEYGTAIPARLAADFIAGRDCFYLSGDDLLLPAKGSGGAARRNDADLLALRSAASGLAGAMQVTEVDPSQAGRYGIVSTRVDQDRRLLLDRLVEKSPAVARTPSSLANISRYLLTPAVVEAAQLLDPDPTTGEFMITSAIQAVSLHSRVGVSVAEGRYFDCGSADGWLAANVATAETNA